MVEKCKQYEKQIRSFMKYKGYLRQKSKTIRTLVQEIRRIYKDYLRGLQKLLSFTSSPQEKANQLQDHSTPKQRDSNDNTFIFQKKLEIRDRMLEHCHNPIELVAMKKNKVKYLDSLFSVLGQTAILEELGSSISTIDKSGCHSFIGET